MTGGVAITVFVLSLLAAIMLHEAGHLLTAKRFGMRADRFFVGFGPTLWSTRRGETEYGVKAFWLGGYVRIVGMSPLDERQPPVVDELLDPEMLAEDRRQDPAGGDGAAPPVGPDRDVASGRVLTDPFLPNASWDRLATSLRGRGTPRALVDRIVSRTRATLAPSAGPEQVRATLLEVLTTEVPDSGRVGDLHHRLVAGDRERFFHDRPAWQRAIVLVAGSVTHFLIAVAVLLGAYLFLPQLTGQVVPVIDAVLEDSPAQAAGLAPGDRVVAVGDVRSERFEDLRQQIASRPDEPVELVYARDGVERTVTVTPRGEVDPETGETIGVVGFVPSAEQVRLGPAEASRQALVGEPSRFSPGGFVPMFTGSLEALVRVFSPQGLGSLFSQAAGQSERGVEGAVSLVGAASIAGQTGGDALGLTVFLALLAAINIFIGIFNLVPLPPLDGGHLAVLGVERAVNGWRSLRGRTPDFSVDPRAVAAIAIPVLAVLGTVFLALLWLDITEPIRFG
jgi:regulator of sigma E protease